MAVLRTRQPDRRARGRRDRRTRKTTLVATLAMTGVVGIGAVATATLASASTLGSVTVPVSADDLNNWEAGWDEAWSQCRQLYPQTRSVHMVGTEIGSGGPGQPSVYAQDWECRDTP